MQVVVVGGGLAGIAAAFQLIDHGHQVVLLESRMRLGGRVGSFWNSQTEQWVDYCQHVGMGCCTQFRWLMDRLGHADAWKVQKTLYFVSPNGEQLSIKPLPCPAPLHLANLLGRWPGLSFKERMSVGWGLWKMMRLPQVIRPSVKTATSETPAEDRTSREDWRGNKVLDWLGSIGQSSRVIDCFWVTILTSALGETIDRISLGDAHKVLIDGFAANRQGYPLLIPQASLTELIEKRALEQLQKVGVDVRLRNGCSSLRWRDGGVDGVETTNGEFIPADHVILATSWNALASLLETCQRQPFSPDARLNSEFQASLLDARQAVERIESSPITGVHTWWDQPWMKTPNAIIIDRLCQWVFQGPNPDGSKEAGHYYQVVISGSRSLPKGDHESILRAVVEELKELFPDAKRSHFLRGRIVTDPQAVFSIPPSSAGGQGITCRLKVDHFAPHRLWLAGDWTDTGWPATMEGAVRSGLAAAHEVMHGKDTKVVMPGTELRPGRLARCLIRHRYDT